MKIRFLLATAVMAALQYSLPAAAETFNVEMRNRGEKESMVFVPDFLPIKPGDSIKIIATHKSHNAASVDGIVPECFAGFKGRINEEIEVSFDHPSFYGIKCSPHFGMGMVMLVKVGEAELTDAIRTVAVRGPRPAELRRPLCPRGCRRGEVMHGTLSNSSLKEDIRYYWSRRSETFDLDLVTAFPKDRNSTPGLQRSTNGSARSRGACLSLPTVRGR